MSGRTTRSLPIAIAFALALSVQLGWSAAPSVAPAGATIGNTVEASIEATLSSFGGDVAVIVADPIRGTGYRHEADQVFHAASLYKLAVMVEAYRQTAAGVVSLDQPVVVEDWDIGDGGVETPAGTSLSVRDAIERMITQSDNSCAYALLDLLDPTTDNETATTTAADLERLFSGLVTGTIVSPSASAEMLAVLGRQQVNDRLPAGLPDGTLIAHTTGNLESIAHDASVIQTAFGPRVVVVLTSGSAPYADVIALMAEIARAATTLPFDDSVRR